MLRCRYALTLPRTAGKKLSLLLVNRLYVKKNPFVMQHPIKKKTLAVSFLSLSICMFDDAGAVCQNGCKLFGEHADLSCSQEWKYDPVRWCCTTLWSLLQVLPRLFTHALDRRTRNFFKYARGVLLIRWIIINQTRHVSETTLHTQNSHAGVTLHSIMNQARSLLYFGARLGSWSGELLVMFNRNLYADRVLFSPAWSAAIGTRTEYFFHRRDLLFRFLMFLWKWGRLTA